VTTPLVGGGSAVSAADPGNLNYNIYYTTSLDPAVNSETQTVTVTATSKTIYGPAQSAITQTASFNV